MVEKTHLQKKMDLALDIKQHCAKFDGQSLQSYFDGLIDELIAKEDLDLIVFAVMKCDKYIPKKNLCILSNYVLKNKEFDKMVNNKSDENYEK